MIDRRSFLAGLTLPATLGSLGCLDPERASLCLARARAAEDDADFWSEIARAFTVDRSIVNLNNGGVSPAPAFVQEAMKRYLDFSNGAPPHTMWRVLEPERETVRQRLARFAGVDAEEIALTRNASEGLQICQFGFDLEPGDEVLATNQDYPRMINTFKQRERREGIRLVQFSIPTPCEDPEEIVRLYEEHITDRTRLILISHVVFLTGQILPVKEVCALGQRRGIPVIVDGAHAFAHVDFRIGDLDCDYYATSLHKWLAAPHGTGLLFVRRDRIPSLWPLMAAPEERKDDIRKFEEIGTHPAANTLGASEALTFHEGIGSTRKFDRLVELRNFWAHRLLENDRVRLHTSLDPRFSGAIANMEIEGVDSTALYSWLWREHRILVTVIRHEEFQGIRVSPSVYTTFEELERFCDAIEFVLREGLPG
ncbi:MAG TPA: aminotransferase class V-fold PLP-dependent enzyme [Planctomycetes bacterium]|nr:aminotransferase class V-fold PLP-dependent enzyme [Planctomycetota bacterium]